MFENLLGTVVPFWIGVIVPISFILMAYIMRQETKEYEGSIGSITMHRRINIAIANYVGINIGVLVVGFVMKYLGFLGG